MADAPNFHSEQLTVGASTTGAVATAFGFGARTLRLLNTEAVDFYVRPGTTSTADVSTGSMRVRACSEVVLPGLPPLRGLAAYTTSTSASAKLLGVTALGG